MTGNRVGIRTSREGGAGWKCRRTSPSVVRRFPLAVTVFAAVLLAAGCGGTSSASNAGAAITNPPSSSTSADTQVPVSSSSTTVSAPPASNTVVVCADGDVVAGGRGLHINTVDLVTGAVSGSTASVFIDPLAGDGSGDAWTGSDGATWSRNDGFQAGCANALGRWNDDYTSLAGVLTRPDGTMAPASLQMTPGATPVPEAAYTTPAASFGSAAPEKIIDSRYGPGDQLYWLSVSADGMTITMHQTGSSATKRFPQQEAYSAPYTGNSLVNMLSFAADGAPHVQEITSSDPGVARGQLGTDELTRLLPPATYSVRDNVVATDGKTVCFTAVSPGGDTGLFTVPLTGGAPIQKLRNITLPYQPLDILLGTCRL